MASGQVRTARSPPDPTARGRQGRRVHFTTAAQLVNELAEAQDTRQLTRLVGRLARVGLLVLDELGYLPLDSRQAELLFQVLAERHKRSAVVITTNLPFGEWTRVFADPRLCKALIDRLTHRTTIIDTGDRSICFDESLGRKKEAPKKNRR